MNLIDYFEIQEVEEVDEQDISPQPHTKSAKGPEGHSLKILYSIPDILDDNGLQIQMTKAGNRLTLPDLEDKDQISWQLVKAALFIAPYHLATGDSFPDRGDQKIDAYCSKLFSLAYDQVLEDISTLVAELDYGSDDETPTNAEEHLESQLCSRKNSYSNKITYKYRSEMNKLVSFYLCFSTAEIYH